ncbi:MAG: SusC/RagA family TonB-linked outer membrane protein [Chitinophagaceae bacterium]|nr:MAG: SusC/RagA family TonB-linked outer membrane protein [Chitinophagaceae bacterium]
MIFLRYRHILMPRQFLLTMRFIILFLTIGMLQVAAKTNGQNVSISGNGISLIKVFKEIKQQAGFVFFYDKAILKKASLVTIHAKKASVESILNQAFQNQPLTWSIKNKTITVIPKPIVEKTNQQLVSDVVTPVATEIRGIVTDEEGAPLSGVSVVVKGTSRGTTTNSIGMYSITVNNDNTVLVFSMVGYSSQEIVVNGRTNINIKLAILVKSQEEVLIVSTGYQNITKERSAGSFAKPDMEIVRNRSTSMNILQRLDGLVPGLTVNNAPQSENPLLIRGLSTIGIKDDNGANTGTNRSPLFVVDGIALDDVLSINPQDVADISVLKDATAASIWGARASNGVIVITTKKGNLNEKVRVQYDGFINFQGKPDLGYVPILTSKQYIQTAKEIFDPVLSPWSSVSSFTNLGSTGVAPHEVILYNRARGIISEDQANKSLDSLASINNHQQIKDLFYRNASLMNHSITLSGGTRNYSFYGSLAATDLKSPTPSEKNNTYKINLRQDFNLNKWLQFYLITDLTNTFTSAGRQPAVDYRFYPYQLFRGNNGENLGVPYVGYLSDSTRQVMESLSRVNLNYVPLDEVNYGYTKSDALMNRITGGTKIKIYDGLRFEGVYGYVRGANKTTKYDDAKSFALRNELVQFTVANSPSVAPTYYLPTTGGNYSVANLTQKNWTVRNQLIYDNSWNNNLHQLTLLAGQEAQSQLLLTTTSKLKGYDEALQTYTLLDYKSLNVDGVDGPVMPNSFGNSTYTEKPFNKTESEVRYVSYYANAGYTFNRKYTVNGSWRVDHSNLFGIDKSAQNKPVWSVGGKWMLGQENFFKNTNWLYDLAFRATYGVTGNAPIPGTASSYDVLSPFTSGLLLNGVGLNIATAGNPKLTWESTKIINFGLDFSVIKNRLNGSVDVYNKKTDNLIGNMAVNSFTGYATIIGNYGSLQNKGVEFSLNSLNVENKNFSWTSVLSLAYNKNIITQLNSSVAITTGEQKVRSQYLTDYPAFAIFAYKYAGLDNLGDPQVYLQDNTITKAPNITKPEDIIYKGTYQPVWSGGLSNSLTYKRFTLAANVIFNLGHVMRVDVSPNYLFSDFAGRIMTHRNIFGMSDQSGFTAGQIHPSFLDRWKKPGDEANTIIPSYLSSTALSETRRSIDYYTFADVNVTSASFAKLRDISLMYSLPESISNSLKIEDIRLRLQVSNIMLWKANKYNIDPEFHDARNGVRTPYTPYNALINSGMNTQSFRMGQGSVTVGVHINF